jgi:hypothetical protein
LPVTEIIRIMKLEDSDQPRGWLCSEEDREKEQSSRRLGSRGLLAEGLRVLRVSW